MQRKKIERGKKEKIGEMRKYMGVFFFSLGATAKTYMLKANEIESAYETLQVGIKLKWNIVATRMKLTYVLSFKNRKLIKYHLRRENRIYIALQYNRRFIRINLFRIIIQHDYSKYSLIQLDCSVKDVSLSELFLPTIFPFRNGADWKV